jgi:hypothetical protein
LRWWPKPQVDNTHPGATSPLGMLSACAFSGTYPTSYGRYANNTENVPDKMFETAQASRPPPLALLLVRHHGVADADRTVLRPPPVTSSRST